MFLSAVLYENLGAGNVEKINADLVQFSEDLSENVDHEEGTSAEEPSVGYFITMTNFSNTFSCQILVNLSRRPYFNLHISLKVHLRIWKPW